MSEEDTKRAGEIYVLLAQLDARAIRPLRENDMDRLAVLNAESDALRVELAALIAKEQA